MKLRGLYAVTPEGEDSERKLRLALEGGIALLQYRSKRRDRAQAAAVVRLAREFGVPVIINDDVKLALELGAAGAHLGRDDGDIGGARARLGSRILGASCYDDLGRARAAVAEGAGEAKTLGVPLAAIGGVTLENAPQLIAAGADLLAVISDLFDAPDIRARAAAYGKLFT